MDAALNGPNGRTILGTPILTIGRGPQNQLVVQDVKASSRHAEIHRLEQGYSLVDLGSTNGTYVNEQKLAPNTFLLLKANDSIRIGDTRFIYEMSSAIQIDRTVRDMTMRDKTVRDGTVQQNAPAYGPPAAVPPPPPNVQPPAYPSYNPTAMPAPYTNYQAGSVPPPPLMPQPNQLAQQLAGVDVGQWIQHQRPKKYWRVFLVGMAAYIVTQVTLYQTGILNLVPLLIFLASFLVPVTFVVFCWEQGASMNIPLTTIGLVFASGAITGLIVAGTLESSLVPTNGQGSLFSFLIVGLCEETAKMIALVWFMGNKRLNSEMQGLILGVTVGMGFAALETAGYGFSFFLSAFASTGGNIGAAINTMISVLNLRMVLAIFGHGVWAAIVASAIWRERGTSSFKLTPGVWFAFGTAVTLHALFDYMGNFSIVFSVAVGLVGLVVLRFFVIDAQAYNKLGPKAPPLIPAFKYYVAHISERYPYPVPQPQTNMP